MLVNDWSARDIQGWEYQPLGPFLGKSFATSISPWVVPAAALERHRVPGPVQTPAPLPYLRGSEPWGLDVELELALGAGGPARVIARTNARELYWTAAQQLPTPPPMARSSAPATCSPQARSQDRSPERRAA